MKVNRTLVMTVLSVAGVLGLLLLGGGAALHSWEQSFKAEAATVGGTVVALEEERRDSETYFRPKVRFQDEDTLSGSLWGSWRRIPRPMRSERKSAFFMIRMTRTPLC